MDGLVGLGVISLGALIIIVLLLVLIF